MLKKRTIVKLLIAIPIIWIFVMIIVGLNDTSSSYASILKIKSLEDENKVMKLAAERYEREKVEKNKNQGLLGILKGGDEEDHPIEELKKAEEQQKQNAGPIQVHAPKNNDPNAPGELGKPVNIDKDKLSPEERVKFDEGWKNNAFNQYASDMISLHRSLADIRDPQ
jgi:hypothetical protein